MPTVKAAAGAAPEKPRARGAGAHTNSGTIRPAIGQSHPSGLCLGLWSTRGTSHLECEACLQQLQRKLPVPSRWELGLALARALQVEHRDDSAS